MVLQSIRERYEAMRDAILASGRPMVFAVCEWGLSEPWVYGQSVSSCSPQSAYLKAHTDMHCHLIQACMQSSLSRAVITCAVQGLVFRSKSALCLVYASLHVNEVLHKHAGTHLLLLQAVMHTKFMASAPGVQPDCLSAR